MKEGELNSEIKKSSYKNIQEPLRVPFDLLNSCKSTNKESKLLSDVKISRESKQSSSVSSA